MNDNPLIGCFSVIFTIAMVSEGIRTGYESGGPFGALVGGIMGFFASSIVAGLIIAFPPLQVLLLIFVLYSCIA